MSLRMEAVVLAVDVSPMVDDEIMCSKFIGHANLVTLYALTKHFTRFYRITFIEFIAKRHLPLGVEH